MYERGYDRITEEVQVSTVHHGWGRRDATRPTVGLLTVWPDTEMVLVRGADAEAVRATGRTVDNG